VNGVAFDKGLASTSTEVQYFRQHKENVNDVKEKYQEVPENKIERKDLMVPYPNFLYSLFSRFLTLQ
jgi:hypothetical protein